MPVDFYTISYMPFFPRGAKKEIRDKYGKLLFNARNTRITVGGNYNKEQATKIVTQLKKQGYKKVTMNQLSVDLLSKCPSCERYGNPEIRPDTRFEIKSPSYRLRYNHSTKPKTCYVGTVSFSSGLQIKLKRGLEIDSLGHARREGVYPLK